MDYLPFKRSSQRWSVRQRGVGVIKVILLIPVALVVLVVLVVAFYEGRKAYWDYRVQEMCEKDGGTKVFETALISRRDAKDSGLLVGDSLVIPTRSDATASSSYYIEYESNDIRSESPKIFRARTGLVRMRDKKVLAEMTTYSRVGGDFPTFAHPSSTECIDADRSLTTFRNVIRIKEERQ